MDWRKWSKAVVKWAGGNALFNWLTSGGGAVAVAKLSAGVVTGLGLAFWGFIGSLSPPVLAVLGLGGFGAVVWAVNGVLYLRHDGASQQLALDLLRQRGVMDETELERLSGLRTAQFRRALAALVAEGRVRRVGHSVDAIIDEGRADIEMSGAGESHQATPPTLPSLPEVSMKCRDLADQIAAFLKKREIGRPSPDTPFGRFAGPLYFGDFLGRYKHSTVVQYRDQFATEVEALCEALGPAWPPDVALAMLHDREHPASVDDLWSLVDSLRKLCPEAQE